MGKIACFLKAALLKYRFACLTKRYSETQRFRFFYRRRNRSWLYLSNELAAPALTLVAALTIASTHPLVPYALSVARLSCLIAYAPTVASTRTVRFWRPSKFGFFNAPNAFSLLWRGKAFWRWGLFLTLVSYWRRFCVKPLTSLAEMCA